MINIHSHKLGSALQTVWLFTSVRNDEFTGQGQGSDGVLTNQCSQTSCEKNYNENLIVKIIIGNVHDVSTFAQLPYSTSGHCCA